MEKRKVLILSCGTGGGHNTAAEAIKESLEFKDIEADVIELYKIVNKKVNRRVNKAYLSSVKGRGRVFGGIYKLGELYPKQTKLHSPVYFFNSKIRDELHKYIVDNGYSYVVSTHIFASHAMTEVNKIYDIPFLQIATDYVCIPFWEEAKPQFSVIPSKDLIKEYTSKGIEEDILLPLGIPVPRKFEKEYSEDDIIKIKEELKLDKEKEHILILSGSMGFGNMENLIESLIKETEDVRYIVACGNNEKLYKKLQEKADKTDRIIPISFTKEIEKYMLASLVVLTKPGGLSTTEIATLNIPIIFIRPIPGCENYNLKFFVERKMAMKVNDKNELIDIIKKITEDREILEEIKKNQKKNILKNSSDKIADIIKKEIEEKWKN